MSEQPKTGNSELFAGLLNESGLDFLSASLLLSKPTKQMRLWLSGTDNPPAEVIWKLSDFLMIQNKMAIQAYERWEKSGRPARINYPVSVCDRSAQKLGWPSRDAQVVVATKAQAMLAPVLVDIVPAAAKSAVAAKPSAEEKTWR